MAYWSFPTAFCNAFKEYREMQKMLREQELLSPKEYGQMLAMKKHKRKKGTNNGRKR